MIDLYIFDEGGVPIRNHMGLGSVAPRPWAWSPKR